MATIRDYAGAIFDDFSPIHRDGHKFVAIGVAATLLLFWIWPSLGWIAALLTALVAYFFRDPARVTPIREGLIVAAADGRIIGVETTPPPPELALGDQPRVRIATRLSLFDVHVNRSPVAGRVTRSTYVPGAFLNAATDDAAHENERRALALTTAGGAPVVVMQIAGSLTRRIVTFAHEGDAMDAGQRFGLIRFGSRVDVYLPPGVNSLVAAGQRSVAGETVIADAASTESARETRKT